MFSRQEIARSKTYLLQPYDPIKSPLFYSWLMSYPLTWVPMINELFSRYDPASKVPVLVYAYPTGNPIILNAHHFKTTLCKRNRPWIRKGWCNFNRMVLIGHSMGGIFVSVDGTNQSRRTVGLFFDIRPARSTNSMSRRTTKPIFTNFIEFEPLPFVSRVILWRPAPRIPDGGYLYWTLGLVWSRCTEHRHYVQNTLKAMGNENIRKTDIKLTSINGLLLKILCC